MALVGDGNAAMVKRELAGLDLTSFAVGALQRASSFLGSFFLFCLFLPFLLTERRAMWTKIALAAGDARLGAEVHLVAADISLGVRHYIGIKSFVSLLTALLSYDVMKPLGLDFAETWAILAFALNFIPSIGSLVAIALPALVALVQFGTGLPALVVLGGLGLVQFAIGYGLEPALTGRSLNLSR